MGWELDKVLDDREKILWEGKPKFWPFFLKRALGSFAAGLFIIIFPVIGWIVGPILLIGGPIYVGLVYKYMHYAITNKRVLIQKGLIWRDFEMVDYDQITNAEVNVGLFDKLFGNGSGSILISTPGTFTYTRKGGVTPTPYTLSHIPAPYEVFKFFKKVSHAVKTDITYPNKYRPKTNPGYNTEYKP